MLRRADALRLARDTMAAREALVALRRAHPGTPEAARGAFLLGAQALDATGAPAQAARWFQLALREAPDAPFAADARGRLAQALDAAGDHEAARAAARDVLARDPEGAFAPLARHILAR